MRKSLRGGDSESESESDSKGDSEGGAKLFFKGAHQGGFRGATSRLVGRFAYKQVPSHKEPSLKSPA